VISTKLKWSDDGKLQPELDGKNCYGEEKLRRIIEYCELSNCPRPVTAYSDHVSDTPMLNWADTGVAVNPSRQLLKIAPSQGFTIANWDHHHEAI
jgi:phosphoserine phosphatase